MTSLTITCPLRCDRTMKRLAPGPLTLKRVCDFDDEDFDEEEWTVKNVEITRIGSRSLIFHAQIYRPHGLPLDAVLKVDPTGEREAAYKHELEAYETKGKALQGSVLPIFYGCFQVRIDSTTITCLAMEYCGEPMEQSLYRVDNPFLGEVVIYTTALHDHGLIHGDLYERNILDWHGHPVLIDLELSASHTCVTRMQTVPGALKPTVEEFGCAELHDLIFRMGLWKPDILDFYTSCIPKNSINSIDDITRKIPEGCSAERRQGLEYTAKRLFEEVCEERRLTYGTDKLSECKTRIDYAEPEDLVA